MPEINVGAPVGAFVDWLTANFGPLFHAISAVMLVLLDAVLIVLTAPSPYIVILVFVALALLERKWGFGLFTLLAFLLILAMGLWVEAMQTLALVVVATLFAVAIGHTGRHLGRAQPAGQQRGPADPRLHADAAGVRLPDPGRVLLRHRRRTGRRRDARSSRSRPRSG